MIQGLLWLVTILPSVVISISGLLLIALGVMNYLDLQAIENIATSKTGGAAVGLVELYGKVSTNKPMKTYATNQNCICSSMTFEKFNRMKKKWSTTLSYDAIVPFDIDDGSGRISVITQGAKLSLGSAKRVGGSIFIKHNGLAAENATEVRNEVESLKDDGLSLGGLENVILGASNPSQSDPSFFLGKMDLYSTATDLQTLAASTINDMLKRKPEISEALKFGGPGWYRVSEKSIPVGSDAFVLGSAEIANEHPGNILIKKGSVGRLVISSSSEKVLASEKKKEAYIWIAVGFSALMLSVLLLVLF